MKRDPVKKYAQILLQSILADLRQEDVIYYLGKDIDAVEVLDAVDQAHVELRWPR